MTWKLYYKAYLKIKNNKYKAKNIHKVVYKLISSQIIYKIIFHSVNQWDFKYKSNIKYC